MDGTVYDGSNIPTVSSNMTISSGSAANTIDGDFTSRANWNSGSTYTSASQQYVYLKVDLGSANKVKHVRVWSNYVGSYENGTNSMNYYGSSTNTSTVNAEGSCDWNRLGPIEMLKSNDTTEQTINSSLYDSKLEFDGYNKLTFTEARSRLRRHTAQVRIEHVRFRDDFERVHCVSRGRIPRKSRARRTLR